LAASANYAWDIFVGVRSAPQNLKSWISKARSAFEIQLLEKRENFVIY
jgi:hypothetical protein